MIYLTPEDIIESAGLSIRCNNALRRAGIYTIGDLLAHDRDKIPEIRNLGAKSINEIHAFLEKVSSDAGDVRIFSSDNERLSDMRIAEKPAVLFRDDNGVLRKDISLEELDLSVRSYNCLKNAGYDFASKLIGITEEVLLSINNLGRNSVIEILTKMATIYFPENSDDLASISENFPCKAFVSEVTKTFALHGGKLYQELLPIFERADEEGKTVDLAEIFSVKILRDAIKSKIMAFLSTFTFGVDKAELMELFTDAIPDYTLIEAIIDEMESEGQIIVGNKIECRKMTILEYVQQIPNERSRDFFLKRLQGLTLEEIGSQFGGVTRERVRQIVAKCMKSKPGVIEDKYIEVYSKYNFSLKDFTLAFGEDEIVYNYLTMVCDKREALPVEELLIDESFPAEIRRSAERIVYKNYITIDGERIYKSRSSLADYVARTYFRSEASFSDFVDYYNMVLEDLWLSDDFKFELNEGTYENRFNEHDNVLWKQGRRFRYYDIDNYDFLDFWQELSLEQYQNVEYSSYKFFRDHQELMHRYDIRDEYELHNLLKKLYRKNGFENINFGRMPMLEFGKADRNGQVLDMLVQLAPVAIQDFAVSYENEYGVHAATFMANFLKSFDEYFHDGVYDISMPQLPNDQFIRMKDVLLEDYYEISDIKRIYQREFPNEAGGNINPYVLKTLGFSVFTSYAIKNTHISAASYFHMLLTKDDIFDTRNFPHGLSGKISYNSELYALKDKYEIVEYEPYCYINIRRLNSIGVTAGHLKEYCDDVAQYVNIGEYFTIASLNTTGFSHNLDNLGFGEVFYSSILLEDTKRFSYQRMGGTKLFRRGTMEASLKGLLEFIVGRKTSIDIYELTELLVDKYGINIERYKIISTVENSPLYYDSIMEKVYIDYDTYFEEV